MIFDSLTFLADGLEEELDAAGIDRALVAAPKPRGESFREANDRVAQALGDRLFGLARVDPLAPGALAEAERALAEPRFLGLFLHPWEESFRITDAAVAPLFELGVPVVVATGYPWVSEGLQVGEVARRHPATTVVATNGAQLNISGLGQTDAELALEENDNLLIQTTGVYREDFLEGVVARFGPERLLFASGFPQLDPRLELLRVQWAPAFDEATRAAVLGGNAERVFG